ncbi:unnamed protein product [Gadus morhua 'NCC']
MAELGKGVEGSPSLQRKKPPWLQLDIPTIQLTPDDTPTVPQQPAGRTPLAVPRSVSMPVENQTGLSAWEPAPNHYLSPPQERRPSITQTIKRSEHTHAHTATHAHTHTHTHPSTRTHTHAHTRTHTHTHIHPHTHYYPAYSACLNLLEHLFINISPKSIFPAVNRLFPSSETFLVSFFSSSLIPLFLRLPPLWPFFAWWRGCMLVPPRVCSGKRVRFERGNTVPPKGQRGPRRVPTIRRRSCIPKILSRRRSSIPKQIIRYRSPEGRGGGAKGGCWERGGAKKGHL